MAAAAIAALWFAFALHHMGLSSGVLRPRLVSMLGDRGFQGLYSLTALAIFVPLCWVYADHKHEGALLWYGGGIAAVRGLAYLGMGAALVLLMAGLLRPSPASLIAGPTKVAGAHRITRHPVLMAAGLFGLAHLLGARIHTTDLAFFAGFPLFVWIGCRHQDRRKLVAGDEAFRRYHDATPFLPFTGSGTLRGLREMPIPLAAGIGLAIALRYFHPSLFGGAG